MRQSLLRPFSALMPFQRPLCRGLSSASDNNSAKQTSSDPTQQRLPRSVQALYLKPLRHTPKYGIPTCDLQIRSYSIQNLELFADFALRAAYYLKLPASGPIPLPHIRESWTVPRSHFIYKRAQENFERITLRRLVQIHDGHPDAVHVWLAFLQKHVYYGLGMKANIWEFSETGVGKTMDEVGDEATRAIEDVWEHMGQHHPLSAEDNIQEMIRSRRKDNMY